MRVPHVAMQQLHILSAAASVSDTHTASGTMESHPEHNQQASERNKRLLSLGL